MGNYLFGPVEIAIGVEVGIADDKSGALAQTQIQLERWYNAIQEVSLQYGIQLYDLELNYEQMKMYRGENFDHEVIFESCQGGESMRDEIIHGDKLSSPYLLIKRNQEYLIILQTVVHDPLTYQQNDIIATLGHTSTNWTEELLIEKGKLIVDSLNEKDKYE